MRNKSYRDNRTPNRYRCVVVNNWCNKGAIRWLQYRKAQLMML